MIHITVKGKPSHIRHLANDPDYLFAIDFHDLTKQTTYVDKEERAVKATVLIRSEQWNHLLQMISEGGDTLADANDIMMEGKMDHTPEEMYTFAPDSIMYRSHLQQKHEEQKSKAYEKKKKTVASKNEPTVSKRVEQLHAKYDGVCQMCGQRCDKKVVSIKKIQSKMGIVCPDCKNGVTFSIQGVKSELQQQLLERKLFSTKQEILDYFKQFCSQFALVRHEETNRMYWSWDKNQIFRMVCISPQGIVYRVKLSKGRVFLPRESSHQITINGNTFRTHHSSIEMRMERIRALTEEQKKSTSEDEIQKQIRYYETKKGFSEKIIVKRADHSKRYQVLTGYAAYQAAKKLNPRTIYVTVVDTLE